MLDPGRCGFLLAQALTVLHQQVVILGENCGESTVAPRANWVLSSATRSSNLESGQMVVAAATDGVHMLFCRGYLQVPV